MFLSWFNSVNFNIYPQQTAPSVVSGTQCPNNMLVCFLQFLSIKSINRVQPPPPLTSGSDFFVLEMIHTAVLPHVLYSLGAGLELLQSSTCSTAAFWKPPKVSTAMGRKTKPCCWHAWAAPCTLRLKAFFGPQLLLLLSHLFLRGALSLSHQWQRLFHQTSTEWKDPLVMMHYLVGGDVLHVQEQERHWRQLCSLKTNHLLSGIARMS